MSAAAKVRHNAEPAFILHRWPYRETSLIIEIFSRNFGRLSLVARGARRPKSAFRGAIHPFQPLHLSWYGRSDLRTLHRAEGLSSLPQLTGTALICGFYLNELLMKLLHRDDPHESLYVSYQETLHSLSTQADGAAVLRYFEKNMLRDLGYAMTLDHDVETGKPIEVEQNYLYVLDRGPMVTRPDRVDKNKLELSGKTLLDMARNDYSDPLTLLQSKILMRMLINHHLGDQILHTRQLLKDLQEL